MGVLPQERKEKGYFLWWRNISAVRSDHRLVYRRFERGGRGRSVEDTGSWLGDLLRFGE